MAVKRPGISNLSREAKRIFKAITSEFAGIDDDPAAVLILKTSLEAFDRMRQAQQAIADHGVVFLDRYGQPRSNPAVAAERDSRAAMLAALRQLNLDLTVIQNPGPGRPPGR
ncbi:MAG: P27 family phage terminase small subunit [Desulfobacterales bacterium]